MSEDSFYQLLCRLGAVGSTGPPEKMHGGAIAGSYCGRVSHCLSELNTPC